MTWPEGVTETEFLAASAHVSKLLYRKLGTYVGTAEDFSQQVVVWSLEALPAYQPGRPLEGFLLSNARNRALNYYRDHVSRRDPPCRACHDGTPCDEGHHCEQYAKWLERNRTKANLSRPVGIEAVMGLTKPSSVEPDAIGAELMALVDQRLHFTMREDYLKLLAGAPVETLRRKRVRQAVAAILGREDLLEDVGRTEVVRTTHPGSDLSATLSRRQLLEEVPQEVEAEVVGSGG